VEPLFEDTEPQAKRRAITPVVIDREFHGHSVRHPRRRIIKAGAPTSIESNRACFGVQRYGRGGSMGSAGRPPIFAMMS